MLPVYSYVQILEVIHRCFIITARFSIHRTGHNTVLITILIIVEAADKRPALSTIKEMSCFLNVR